MFVLKLSGIQILLYFKFLMNVIFFVKKSENHCYRKVGRKIPKLGAIEKSPTILDN